MTVIPEILFIVLLFLLEIAVEAELAAPLPLHPLSSISPLGRCLDMTCIVTRYSRLYYRTYVVSAPIIPYYYTQLIGDARKPPTLLATSGFQGIAVIGEPPRSSSQIILIV